MDLVIKMIFGKKIKFRFHKLKKKGNKNLFFQGLTLMRIVRKKLENQKYLKKPFSNSLIQNVAGGNTI